MIQSLESQLRAVSNFFKPEVVFRNITPVLAHPPALRQTLDELMALFEDHAVTGVEARDFSFGGCDAWKPGVGPAPPRNPGKLPKNVHNGSSQLARGSASLEIHASAPRSGEWVRLMDDLIATRGTAAAGRQSLEKNGRESRRRRPPHPAERIEAKRPARGPAGAHAFALLTIAGRFRRRRPGPIRSFNRYKSRTLRGTATLNGSLCPAEGSAGVVRRTSRQE